MGESNYGMVWYLSLIHILKKDEVDERISKFNRFMNGEVIGQKKLIRNYSAGNKQKIGIILSLIHIW